MGRAFAADLKAQIAFDTVVVGGGSAGCVLASRLSEDPSKRVLLVEAGCDLSPGAVPPVIASPYPGRAYFNKSWTWPELRVAMGADPKRNDGAPSRFYEQARILGGGSSINGIGANRGAPSDFDEWEAQGARGWGWNEVLPFFKKLENDLDYGHSDIHGNSGPIPIKRLPRVDHSQFVRDVEERLRADGFDLFEDQNGAWRDGLYPIATNLDAANRRASTATTYLSNAVRARSNLTVWTGTSADRLLMEGRKAIGVRLLKNGEPVDVRANRIIVSCGAIHSPVLLLRSGIGPAHELQELGIETLVARDGIGRNLQEHPSIGVSTFLPRRTRMPGGEHYHIQSILRWSSGTKGVPSGDMHLSLNARSGWHKVGYRIGTLFGWVNKSFSKGWVTLRSPDPSVPPHVDFRLLSDRRDLHRLASSFRLAATTLQALAADGRCSQPFPSTYSDRVRKWMRPTKLNGLMMAFAGPAIDASSRMRDFVVKIATEGNPPLETLLEDEDQLHRYLIENVGGVWHPCGTCRIGDPSDPFSVCDSSGKVIGTAGLYVCDASVMPTIPCANLNVPTIMIAEKIAHGIRQEPS